MQVEFFKSLEKKWQAQKPKKAANKNLICMHCANEKGWELSNNLDYAFKGKCAHCNFKYEQYLIPQDRFIQENPVRKKFFQ